MFDQVNSHKEMVAGRRLAGKPFDDVLLVDVRRRLAGKYNLLGTGIPSCNLAVALLFQPVKETSMAARQFSYSNQPFFLGRSHPVCQYRAIQIRAGLSPADNVIISDHTSGCSLKLIIV